MQNAVTKERREKGEKILEEWRNRYSGKINELKLKEVEDHVKHLSVSKTCLYFIIDLEYLILAILGK